MKDMMENASKYDSKSNNSNLSYYAPHTPNPDNRIKKRNNKKSNFTNNHLLNHETIHFPSFDQEKN